MPDVAPTTEHYPLYAGSHDDAFGVGTVSIATMATSSPSAFLRRETGVYQYSRSRPYVATRTAP